MNFTNIFDASKKGIIEDVRHFIEQKDVNINAKNNDGVTALHYAAAYNPNVNVSEYLVSKGADINAKNNDGGTAFYFAVLYKSSIDVLKYLISQGADINIRNNNGWTPLHCAVLEGYVDAFNLLISAGADVNVLTIPSEIEANTTPLHIAALKNNVEFAKALIFAGADINRKNDDGWTPLHMAVQEANLEVIKILVSVGVDINVKDKNGLTIIGLAKHNGNAEIVEYISGILTQSVSFTEAEQKDIINFYMVIEKDIENVKKDIKEVDEHGFTLLHKAAGAGLIGAVKFLIIHGVDINAKNKSGDTSLHAVAWGTGNVDVAKLIISKNKTIVNSKNGYGATPLHIAVHKENFELVKFLISKGSDVNVSQKDGLTPLHFATIGNIEVAKVIVAAGAHIDTKSNNGNTPLCDAVYNGHTEVAKFLISQGADVNVKVNNGFSVLHAAVFKNNIEVTQILISKGANVNAQSDSGFTPLHVAAGSDLVEIVKILVSGKADINIKDNKGFTPLILANQMEKKAVAEYLSYIVSRSNELLKMKLIRETAEENKTLKDNISKKEEQKKKNLWIVICEIIGGIIGGFIFGFLTPEVIDEKAKLFVIFFGLGLILCLSIGYLIDGVMDNMGLFMYGCGGAIASVVITAIFMTLLPFFIASIVLGIILGTSLGYIIYLVVKKNL